MVIITKIRPDLAPHSTQAVIPTMARTSGVNPPYIYCSAFTKQIKVQSNSLLYNKLPLYIWKHKPNANTRMKHNSASTAKRVQQSFK